MSGWKKMGRVAVLLGPGLVTAWTATAEPSVSVPQGQVGRWAGGAETCGMDGRTWKALEGVCYYPIDFERAVGRVEIARWLPGKSMERAWLDITAKDYGDQVIDFPDDRYVHPPPEDLEQHYQQQAKVKPVFRRRTPAVFTLPLGKPAEPLPEGRYFGVRRTFNGEPKNAHTGTDYAISLGQPARSVADGEVVLVGDHFFSGKAVYVDHGDGLISMYFHLDDFTVEKGTKVEKGDTVAKIGSTGRSTGPHLHLGLRWRGARIDPTPLMGSPESLPSVP